jgi:phage/plasmid primase-like uncharacterized protein
MMPHTEALEQFRAALVGRELVLPANKDFVADGNWHRCDVLSNGSRGKDDGTYLLTLDGRIPWGLFRNWTDGRGVDHWRGKPTRALTEAERAQLEREIEQRRREHEKAAAAAAAEAREKAWHIWEDRAKAAPSDHPYLKTKGIAPRDIRIYHGALVVPMYADGADIANLQLIFEDGRKSFLKGGRTKGCFFPMPVEKNDGPIVIGEGFATVASIGAAVGCDVIAAFSAGNLAAVANRVRLALNQTNTGSAHDRREMLVQRMFGSSPDRALIIAADDDWKSKSKDNPNPGLLAAIAAARAARAKVAVPNFGTERSEGEKDFNDLAQRLGGDAVRTSIAAAREPNEVLREWLMAAPHIVFKAAMVKELAALKRDDASFFSELRAGLMGLKGEKKIDIRGLDRAIGAALDEAEAEAAASARQDRGTEEKADIDKLARLAHAIITNPDILKLFAQQCERVIAGEEKLTKLLYLGGTSRLLDRAVHVAIKGTSAGGKSEVRRRVLKFFPPEAVIAFTAQSERALLYFEGDFAHKILSMGEAINQDEVSFQDYLLRELLSEGQLNYPVVQKQDDNTMKTITITKSGPVAFMVTTTRNKLHPENETRMLSVEINDSAEQTKSVMDMVAQVEGLNQELSVNLAPWHDFQLWLEAGERRVTIPWAKALAALIPPKAVRLRRDVGQLLRVIKAHALLHRHHPTLGASGIEATIDQDYARVRELLADLLAQAAEVKVSTQIKETVNAVTQLGANHKDGVGVKLIADRLGLDLSTARRRLQAARDAGLVTNLEDRPRRPGRYKASDHKTSEADLLPSEAELRAHHESAKDSASATPESATAQPEPEPEAPGTANASAAAEATVEPQRRRRFGPESQPGPGSDAQVKADEGG